MTTSDDPPAGTVVNMRPRVTPLREPETLDGVRLPPCNPDAEQALLGALMINNPGYFKVADFLQPEHFGYGVHGRIYEAMGKLIQRGQMANPVTLKNLFDQDGALTEIGGAQYLARLAASAVTIINTEDYARVVYDLHLRRELINLGEDIVNGAFRQDLDTPASMQIEIAETALFDLATTGQAEGSFEPFAKAMTKAISNAEAAYKRSGKTVGVATGFLDLDAKLGGLHASDLVILAGRTAMGKTALATNIAFNAARAYRERFEGGKKTVEDGAVVGFFSLEMSTEQLATRVLAEMTGISSDRIRRGAVSRDDFDGFVAAANELQGLPLYIDDTPALTISALRTRARRLMRQKGLGLIVVDYLQLLRPSPGRQPENRVQEVSEISRGLKALAKELDVPVLALSQLSRAVEQREDKRPMLADLRESGSIEQDADVVMFIFREEYYRSRPPLRDEGETDAAFETKEREWREELQKVTGLGEVIIAKQRHGPIGTIKLRFDASSTRFEDFTEQAPADGKPAKPRPAPRGPSPTQRDYAARIEAEKDEMEQLKADLGFRATEEEPRDG